MYVTCKERKTERIAALEVYDEVLVYAKISVCIFLKLFTIFYWVGSQCCLLTYLLFYNPLL